MNDIRTHQLLLEKANALYGSGQYEEAEVSINSAIEKNKGLRDYPNTWLILSRISMAQAKYCLLYTSPSPRDRTRSRMPSSA